MQYPKAKIATGKDGSKIKIGDDIESWNYGSLNADGTRDPDKWMGVIVRVTDIHKQGRNGTILHCEPAPNPDYPHHFSVAAREARLVRKGL